MVQQDAHWALHSDEVAHVMSAKGGVRAACQREVRLGLGPRDVFLALYAELAIRAATFRGVGDRMLSMAVSTRCWGRCWNHKR